MSDFEYEGSWRPYEFPADTSRLATQEEIRADYPTLYLDGHEEIQSGGLPLISDGNTFTTYNPRNQNALIYGTSQSGKSRRLIAPLICMLARAHESMVITDLKGELSQGALAQYIIPALMAQGYNIRILDFRSFNKDGYNLLGQPYMLFRSGNTDDAAAEISAICAGLSAPYRSEQARSDPFWVMLAEPGLAAFIRLILEFCDNPQQLNFLSIAQFTSESAIPVLKAVVDHVKDRTSNVIATLENLMSQPEKTRLSTMATINSFFAGFLGNDSLLRMLSYSTFGLVEIIDRPTALFLVVPDETSAYSHIVSTVISQVARYLVRTASVQYNGVLPRRVNFICDEFPNFFMPDMDRALSTHLSRNIRYFLACQSKKQMCHAYPKEADTIISNCANTYFLSSPEEDLLEELSSKAGTTHVSPDGTLQRLVPVDELRHLRQTESGTEMYVSIDGGRRTFFTCLPDISQYNFGNAGKDKLDIKTRTFSPCQVFTPEMLMEKIIDVETVYEAERRGDRPSLEKKADAARLKRLLGGM